MIIGFAGCAGSGKDTAANVLVNDRAFVKMALADPIKRALKMWFGWSDEILWGPSHNRRYMDPLTGLTVRYILQRVGTDVGREIDADLWTNILLRDAMLLLSSGVVVSGKTAFFRYTPQAGITTVVPSTYDNADSMVTSPHALCFVTGHTATLAKRIPGVVVSDVRFANEARAIRAAGGRVIRLLRDPTSLPPRSWWRRLLRRQRHISETLEGVPVDGVIDNRNMDVAEFEAEVRRMVAGMLK